MSPRTAQANQQVRDERQEQILKAALRVFGRQGFAAAKISDIASEAGVSYGLVDHYFGKKEEIYTVVVARAYAGALGLLEDGLGRPGTPWERLQYVCETMLAGNRVVGRVRWRHGRGQAAVDPVDEPGGCMAHHAVVVAGAGFPGGAR